MKVSICIPTYEMHGKGTEFLFTALKSIKNQTYKNIEIVVSDHSSNEKIKRLCSTLNTEEFPIKYIRNKNNKGSSSANLNNSMRNATGDIIKILFQDDYFFSTTCIEDICNIFKDKNANWAVVSCIHTVDGVHYFNPMVPYYNKNIYLGINTISSPSVLAIRNTDLLLFDENLIWLMDVDYYKRLYDVYGEPVIIKKCSVVNRLWEGQITNSVITNDIKKREQELLSKKYK